MGIRRRKFNPLNSIGRSRKTGRFVAKSSRRRRAPRKGKVTTQIVRGPAVIADRTLVKLKYNEIVNFTNAGNFGAYTFTGNGMYDCNITSTGTQPTGYDQYSGYYFSYRVMGSRITVKACSAVAHPCVIGVLPCIDYLTISAAGINTVVREPRSKNMYLASNATTVGVINHYQSTKSAYGERDINETDYEGNTGNIGVGSNPQNIWYWLILAANVDGAAGVGAPIHVEIEYYVEFFHRVDLATS